MKVVAAACIALTVAACTPSHDLTPGASSPEAAVRRYLGAIESRDRLAASTLVAPKFRSHPYALAIRPLGVRQCHVTGSSGRGESWEVDTECIGTTGPTFWVVATPAGRYVVRGFIVHG